MIPRRARAALAGLIPMSILAATSGLVACRPVTNQTQRQESTRSEYDMAIEFAENPARIVERTPWKMVSAEGGVRDFSRTLTIAAYKSQELENIVMVGSVADGRVDGQLARYKQLQEAVRKGRSIAGPRLPKSGLIPLDMGRNVASVEFIGTEEKALECEITGFHMPSYIFRCSWIANGSSYGIEADPRLIGVIEHFHDSLVQAAEQES